MGLTPFYAVTLSFAITIILTHAWRLVQAILLEATSTSSRCSSTPGKAAQSLRQLLLATVTNSFHQHVKVVHSVSHSVSMCSDLLTNIHNPGSQPVRLQQKRVCLPNIDDELVDHIAQQIHRLHCQFDSNPVVYQQKLLAELSSLKCQEQDFNSAPDYAGASSHGLASASGYPTRRPRNPSLTSPGLHHVSSRPSRDDQPDDFTELDGDLDAAETQLALLVESVEGLVTTIEQSIPYRI